MHKIPFTLALVAVFSGAAHAETYKITEQGMDIDVQVTRQADGNRMISGVNNLTGETFALTASDSCVWGRYGTNDVSFRTMTPTPYTPAQAGS